MIARATMLFGHMAAGRTERAIEIATELRLTLPTLVDPVSRCWATVAIIQTLAPATIAADADAALAAACASAHRATSPMPSTSGYSSGTSSTHPTSTDCSPNSMRRSDFRSRSERRRSGLGRH